jgi:Flp pilus assembly protein TadG
MLLAAFAIVGLLAVTALAVDIGRIWTERRQMQTAADAAALAGDHQIYSSNGTDSGGANWTPTLNAALNDSANNGYTNGSNGVTVAVHSPPSSGPWMGNKDAVEVIVSKAQPTFLLRVLGINSMPVSARAVARYIESTGCVYALDPSAQGALTVSGTATLTAGCNIFVDSTSTSALSCTGGGSISAKDPATGGPLAIDVVGGASASGSCVPNPTPTTGTQAAGNPFASLPVPSAPAVVSASPLNISVPHLPLNPGTYDGGISVSGGNSVVFNPGLYYLNGGGLNVTGGSNITGAGVTFFNTGTASGPTQYKPIVISGGSSSALTAPTSGTYTGILFFQDPNICLVKASFCGPSGPQNTITSATTAVFSGALDFANTPVKYSGGSGTVGSGCTEIVADTITVTGSSTVSMDCALFGNNGAPLKFPTLAE